MADRLAAGKVAEVKEGTAEVKSNKGNVIKKHGDAENPAVVIEREGVSVPRGHAGSRARKLTPAQNNVVKKASELNEVDL